MNKDLILVNTLIEETKTDKLEWKPANTKVFAAIKDYNLKNGSKDECIAGYITQIEIYLLFCVTERRHVEITDSKEYFSVLYVANSDFEIIAEYNRTMFDDINIIDRLYELANRNSLKLDKISESLINIIKNKK